MNEKNESILINEVKMKYSKKLKHDELYQVSSSGQLNSYIRKFIAENDIDLDMQEHFFAIYLNRKNKVIGTSLLFIGGIASTVVDIRFILASAINTLSSSVVLVHNHPSGNLKPSMSDRDITKNINKALKLFDCSVLDHLIINGEDNNYYSFADEGENF